jgi:hypothetical protein
MQAEKAEMTLGSTSKDVHCCAISFTQAITISELRFARMVIVCCISNLRDQQSGQRRYRF